MIGDIVAYYMTDSMMAGLLFWALFVWLFTGAWITLTTGNEERP